jgi:hypothetical protein
MEERFAPNLRKIAETLEKLSMLDEYEISVADSYSYFFVFIWLCELGAQRSL